MVLKVTSNSCRSFAYGAFTFYGSSFQNFRLDLPYAVVGPATFHDVPYNPNWT